MSTLASRHLRVLALGCCLGVSGLAPLACSGGGSPRHAERASDGGDAAEEPQTSGGETALAGDSAGGSDSTPSAMGGAETGGEQAGAGGSTDAPTLASIAVAPQAPELPVTLGSASEPLHLTATATWSDETSGTAKGGSWSSDAPSVAQVDENGVVTATGDFGGAVTIHYVLGKLDATTVVHVELSVSVFEGGVTPADGAKLDAAANVDASAPLWQYPEDQTVFPARMAPPKLQWAANGNDLFRLQLSRGSDVHVDVYTSLSTYAPSKAVWAALTASYGKPIDLGLAGKLGAADGAVRAAAARSVFAADADLSGLLYYFDVSSGKLRRLSLADASSEPIFPGDQQCRSCHTPARDGSLIAFQYDGGGENPGGVFASKTSSEVLSKANNSRRWDFATFRPDSRAMLTSFNGAFQYFDLSTPASPVGTLNAAPDLGGLHGTQPTWSPDGSTLAFIAHDAASADWAFTSSDLRVASYDRQKSQFGAASLLVSANAVSGDTLTNPTWSPDSRYLAVGLGDQSYAPSSMSLDLVDVKAKTRVALARASAFGINETPSFAPLAQGGYNWLVFTSNRAYGAATGNRLFWITAVDQDAEPGKDPSHPAFFVPGQDTTGSHLLPQWAPLACSGHDATCATDQDCCEGLSCSGDATKTCQAVSCSVLGQACTQNTDCCAISGVTCRAGLDGVKVCQR